MFTFWRTGLFWAALYLMMAAVSFSSQSILTNQQPHYCRPLLHFSLITALSLLPLFVLASFYFRPWLSLSLHPLHPLHPHPPDSVPFLQSTVCPPPHSKVSFLCLPPDEAITIHARSLKICCGNWLCCVSWLSCRGGTSHYESNTILWGNGLVLPKSLLLLTNVVINSIFTPTIIS